MATIIQLPPGLRTARLIAASMISGVTLFAVVATFVVQQRGGAPAAEGAAILFYGWLGLAFASLLAVVLLWRIHVAPRIERVRTAQDGAAHGQALQTALVITWALLEGPALLALVIYFLAGSTLALAAGLLLAWLGIGLTFPRAAWFAPRVPRR